MELSQADQQLLEGIISREGGWTVTDAEYDRGGLSYGGMTLRTLNNWLRAQKRDAIDPVDFRVHAKCADERLQADVLTCYTETFIRPFDWISPVVLRGLVIDAAVTSGVTNAVRILQRAVGTAADGVAGPNTGAATRAAAQHGLNRLLVRITRERVEFFIRITQGDPTQLKWLAGWCRRAFDLLDEGA